MRRSDPSRLPPAFRLACACCAWPPSARRDAAVRAAAEGVDWERFARVVVRQRIPGLAWAALMAAGLDPPEDILERLGVLATLSENRSCGLAAESVRLRRRFEAAGVEVLFLKGAALGQLAYGDPGLKQGRDIDLLVSPLDAEPALRLLCAEGYQIIAPARNPTEAQRRIVYRLHKDMELFHPERRLNVELHWRLVDNPELLKGVGPDSARRDVALADGALPTLADGELFAYLCAHGASHAWFRLKWLADLNAWLTSKDAAQIAGLYREAARLGVEDCAGEALALCHRLLGLEIPASLAPAPKTARVRRLVAGALDAMIGPDGETELSRRPFGGLRLLPAQYLRGRGRRFLLAQGRLHLDSLDDRLALPLPRRLGFLYPLLRGPMWLVRVVRRRLGRAAGTVRSSRFGDGMADGT